ncbi:hypothetical protein G9A89_010931 [Geosiphon pyriformis]|nr:hypothetical protein G9A89_010931 [Geosiphon pyriformis]
MLASGDNFNKNGLPKKQEPFQQSLKKQQQQQQLQLWPQLKMEEALQNQNSLSRNSTKDTRQSSLSNGSNGESSNSLSNSQNFQNYVTQQHSQQNFSTKNSKSNSASRRKETYSLLIDGKPVKFIADKYSPIIFSKATSCTSSNKTEKLVIEQTKLNSTESPSVQNETERFVPSELNCSIKNIEEPKAFESSVNIPIALQTSTGLTQTSVVGLQIDNPQRNSIHLELPSTPFLKKDEELTDFSPMDELHLWKKVYWLIFSLLNFLTLGGNCALIFESYSNLQPKTQIPIYIFTFLLILDIVTRGFILYKLHWKFTKKELSVFGFISIILFKKEIYLLFGYQKLTTEQIRILGAYVDYICLLYVGFFSWAIYSNFGRHRNETILMDSVNYLINDPIKYLTFCFHDA